MGTLIDFNTMTQKALILRFMSENGSISQLEAAEEIGCWRLSSRIWDLKQDGHQIDREMVTKKNRYGKPVSFARYRLRKEGDG